MTFRDLLVLIGRAGAEAHAEAADAATAHRIRRHFETREEDGVNVARTFPVAIDADQPPIRVPTFLFDLPERLQLREFEIELETDIRLPRPALARAAAEASECDDGEMPEIEVGLTRGMNEQRSHVQIKAKFGLGPPTEAVSQLQQTMNDELRARLAGEEDVASVDGTEAQE